MSTVHLLPTKLRRQPAGRESAQRCQDFLVMAATARKRLFLSHSDRDIRTVRQAQAYMPLVLHRALRLAYGFCIIPNIQEPRGFCYCTTKPCLQLYPVTMPRLGFSSFLSYGRRISCPETHEISKGLTDSVSSNVPDQSRRAVCGLRVGSGLAPSPCPSGPSPWARGIACARGRQGPQFNKHE
ncbi:hypothetical protein BD309DRAFT_56556 [Dichomitus squalens]|nr:hypothetical protein BD309DRAFT_56556 [Dichomitus squalens]